MICVLRVGNARRERRGSFILVRCLNHFFPPQALFFFFYKKKKAPPVIRMNDNNGTMGPDLAESCVSWQHMSESLTLSTEDSGSYSLSLFFSFILGFRTGKGLYIYNVFRHANSFSIKI